MQCLLNYEYHPDQAIFAFAPQKLQYFDEFQAAIWKNIRKKTFFKGRPWSHHFNITHKEHGTIYRETIKSIENSGLGRLNNVFYRPVLPNKIYGTDDYSIKSCGGGDWIIPPMDHFPKCAHKFMDRHTDKRFPYGLSALSFEIDDVHTQWVMYVCQEDDFSSIFPSNAQKNLCPILQKPEVIDKIVRVALERTLAIPK